MDFLSLLRMMGALLLVLGMLAGGLWVVRRYNLRLPGALAAGFKGRGQSPRLALVERISLDARRSIALIRRDDREHLILLAPDGMLTIETGIRAPSDDAAHGEEAPHG
jgi:flagellar protein FliO/FliZ